MININNLSVSECNRLFNCLSGLSSAEKIVFMKGTRCNTAKDALEQLLLYLNPFTGNLQRNNLYNLFNKTQYGDKVIQNLSQLSVKQDNFDTVILDKCKSVGIDISSYLANSSVDIAKTNRACFGVKNCSFNNGLNLICQSGDSKINSICQRLMSEISKIKTLKHNIYYVNAGRMNHGKSSLFNALAHKKEMFKTGDVRTTTEQQMHEFMKDIIFIDTPGLDAKDKDDKLAFEGYKKADLIIFVHTPNIGELHRNEIDRIKQIAALFPSNIDFWKRFCLVFTFKEALEEDQFNIIKSKVIKDIEIHCGGKNFPIFNVSNMDYWDGVDNNSKQLVAISGIPEFRNFLIDYANYLKTKAESLRKQRIDVLQKQALKELNDYRRELDRKVSSKTNEIARKRDRILSILQKMDIMIREKGCIESYSMQELYSLRNEIAHLKNKHEREYY